MSKEILLIISCVIGYLLGSLSGGIIISRLAGGPDLHTVGSKSTGASNVQRTMAALLAGLCCVIGHNWPVFFRFHGGKGVATTGAVMLYCFPLPALACIALTVAVIAAFRYISVGSMLLVVAFFILSFFFSSGNACVIIWAAILMVMCVARHHANIGRLIRGTENRLGKKAQ